MKSWSQLKATTLFTRVAALQRLKLSEEQLDPDDYEARFRRYVGIIKELLQTAQYREETRMDRDAIVEVFGRDRGGFIWGMGGDGSKTELLASAIPM
ncbi:hypothetical protein MKW98_010689 [Papaver atlanticum]|uniref:Uncharacterized protein n=1 Tax=Papaver atlanticum TaxID=357466 RepID=A0AAD4SJJ9_9MAGN|nr:hypothetical protein MKW98_010689 [Papaver atlanticum]